MMDLSTNLLIVGGGPAGISAAVWAEDLGIEFILVDRSDVLGGQLRRIFNQITNYPGFVTINSAELLQRFVTQLKTEDGVHCRSNVVGVDPAEGHAFLENGRCVRFRSMIIATGVRRRELGVPGEKEFHGRGILDSGARDPQQVAGKDVAVIGGGDAAFENALILSAFARRVYLIHRRAVFTAREAFIDNVHETKNVEILSGYTVEAFIGENVLRRVDIRISDDKGDRKSVEIDRALIRIGVQPNTEFLNDLAALDSSGYISVTNSFETDLPNIYAIGDVALPGAPTIASAVGSAAIALKSLERKSQMQKV